MSHLAEDVLVRRLDGELDPAEADRVEAHLTDCARCRSEMEEIERISRRFSAALPLLDPPPAAVALPSRGARLSPIWRAAAVIALLAGLALAIAPVRAWVAERLGLAGADRAGAPPVAAGDRLPPAGRAGGDLRIAFVPAGDRFVIRIAAPQAAGALILAAAPGDTASAQVVDPEGAPADILVLPDGLAIRNRPSSTADFRVVVPGDLSRIEVHVGERLAWSGSPDRLTRATTIDLSRAP